MGNKNSFVSVLKKNAMLVVLVIVYLFFNMDYSRIESVQFEDDDYYYYVKAVPKVTVSDSLRTVKTISTSKNSGASFREQVNKKEKAAGRESDE